MVKLSCFMAGTMVLTVMGLVAIENIKAGNRIYLDVDGKPIPNNKVVDGKQVGITKSEYNQLTHFNNTDD